MTPISPSQQHYTNALEIMLSNPALRVFLWRLIVEDCKVFEEGFPMNAQAYCLLAKQEIGKRLLADAKAVSPDLVFQAEKEYKELCDLMERYLNNEIKEKSDDSRSED